MTTDVNFNNTALLIYGTSPIIDNSSNNYALTVTGSNYIDTIQNSPFAGISETFDLENAYIYSSANTKASQFNTNNFTIEMFLYLKNINSYYGRVFSLDAYDNVSFLISGTSMDCYGLSGSGQSGWSFSVATLTVGAWQHIAFVRNGIDFSIYINGILAHSRVINVSATYNGSVFRIGEVGWLPKALISNFRVTNGVARYTTNFSVPTMPFYSPKLRSIDFFIDNVSLYIPFSGVNNSTNILDFSNNQHTITVLDNTKITTNITNPFSDNDGVGYFDGTTDVITFNNTEHFNFSNEDFTMEFWVYLLGYNPNYSRIYNTEGDAYNGLAVSISPGGDFSFYMSSIGTSWDLIANANAALLALNTWYHIAIVRNKGSVYTFKNGVKVLTNNILDSVVLYNTTESKLCIGGQTSTNRSLNGYLSQFKITKGVARYKNNFIPTKTVIKHIDVTITDNIIPDNFNICIYDLKTYNIMKVLSNKIAGYYNIMIYSDNPCLVTVVPDNVYDIWRPNAIYYINDLVFPSSPTIPYYFKRIVDGVSNNIEPTWNTTINGYTSDNNINNAWQCISRLVQPITQSPLLPI